MDFIRNPSFLWVEHYSVMNARIGKEKGVLTCLINILSRHENFNMTAIVFLHISAHYFFG